MAGAVPQLGPSETCLYRQVPTEPTGADSLRIFTLTIRFSSSGSRFCRCRNSTWPVRNYPTHTEHSSDLGHLESDSTCLDLELSAPDPTGIGIPRRRWLTDSTLYSYQDPSKALLSPGSVYLYTQCRVARVQLGA